MLFTPLLPSGVISTDTGTLRKQIKVKRRTQPQIKPKISAYWRSRGFKWVVNGTEPRELVSGAVLDPTAGATQEVNHSGKALANRSTGVGWTKSISSSPAKEATLVWFGDFYTGGGTLPFLAGILPNITDGSPYSNVALIRARSTPGQIGYFYADAAGFSTFVSSPNADYDEAKNLGIVAKIKDGSQKLFTNKRGLELTTTTALGGGGLFTQTPILVLGSGNPTRNAAASCSLFAVSDQFLTDEECLSLAKNPWQIFESTPQTLVATKGIVSRPNSDLTSSGWSYNSNTSFYDAIDEPSYTDIDAIVSPNLNATPGPVKFGLDTSLDTGTYNVNVRARRTDTTGDIRATLIDSAGNVVGTSSWQTLTAVYQTYTLSVTTTATASRVGFEVRP